MSYPIYRTYFLADWTGDVTAEDLIQTPNFHEVTLPAGEGAVERVMELKYDYIAKTGRQPTKLITWPKFYEQLMGAMMRSRVFQGASGFPNIIEGMAVCIVPVPITYVCGDPETDFPLYYRESDGNQEETSED